jgi:DNA-binding transcriptional MerR regulator
MNPPQAQISQDDALDPIGESAGRRAGKSAAAFRTISEVAADLDVPPHVLRFWESKFSQIKPLKRGGGRRYYRPEDIELLRRIRTLLYRDGYTIKGVQKLLRSPGVRAVAEEAAPAELAAAPEPIAAAAEPEAPLPGAGPGAGRGAGQSAGPVLDAERRAAVAAAIDELSDLRKWLANKVG